MAPDINAEETADGTDAQTDASDATDEDEGGSGSGSKYVISTGPGYQGILSVTNKGNVRIHTAQTAIGDWELGTPVYGVPHPDGIALVRDPEGWSSIIGQFSIKKNKNSEETHTVQLNVGTVSQLGVEPGGDIRIYDLRKHTEESQEGLLLVDAEADPVKKDHTSNARKDNE